MRALLKDRGLKRGAGAGRAIRLLSPARAAIGIRRRDQRDVDEPIVEQRLVALPRRRRKSEQSIAVIAGFGRDDLVLAGLAGLDPILTRELACGLHGLRSAGQEIDFLQIAGTVLGDE